MESLLSKYQNMIAGVLIALILVYGSYHYIYKPKIAEINGLKNSLKMINGEIVKVPGGDLLIKDTNAARSMIKKELDDLSSRIPPETSTPYLINNFISIVGNGLNIDYNLIQPGEIVQEQKYKRLPLTVEFESQYSDLNAYLAQLKKLPVTIRVDSLDVHRVADNKNLQVRMQVSAFVMPGGTAKPPSQEKGNSYIFDPFFAQRAVKAQAPIKPAIQGLKYSGYWIGKEIKAIINDDVLKAGESVNGFMIVKIYKDHVILKKDNKQYELPLVKQ